MLERIGMGSADQLFDSVPASLRKRAGLKLAPSLDERSLLAYLGDYAARNQGAGGTSSFIGAGAYHHFIPSVVDTLAGRGEFATAYTPYQAEISQGTLQAVYEFQTMICQLTGLDVANASLYDGASATAEACLMALRTTRRKQVLVSAGLHPHYRRVIETYLSGLDAEVKIAELAEDGTTAIPTLDKDTAALVIQSPNFFGCIEHVAKHSEAAHTAGALLIHSSAEPLAMALLRAPGDAGADVACGEAQSFGVPLSFGGPYAGFFAAREKWLRQLPGRLIGETLDSDGQRAFVMTLTTREQHIRRERATSNICTNQGLCALRVTIYLALLGRQGLRTLAEHNLSLAAYARESFAQAGFELPYSAPTFNEFVVRVPKLDTRYPKLASGGILAGYRLREVDASREDELLVCVTEQNSRDEIDQLVRELAA